MQGSWNIGHRYCKSRGLSDYELLITPIKVLITFLTKSHDPPRRLLSTPSPAFRRPDQRSCSLTTSLDTFDVSARRLVS